MIIENRTTSKLTPGFTYIWHIKETEKRQQYREEYVCRCKNDQKRSKNMLHK